MCWLVMVLGQGTLWQVVSAPVGSMANHAMGGNLCSLSGLTHFRQKIGQMVSLWLWLE